MRVMLVVMAALTASGCASVTRGTTDQIQFDSEPTGAEVRTMYPPMCGAEDCMVGDDRTAPMSNEPTPGPACTTPCVLTIARNRDLDATFTKAGYEPQMIPIRRRVAAAGVAGVAGNVLIGGVTGIVVDSATGAGMDHFPNPAKAILVPVKSTEVIRDRRGRR